LFLLLRALLQGGSGGGEVGQNLYNLHCMNCHQEDGKGVRGLVPPLAGADYLQTQRQELPCIIKYGLKGKIVVNGREFDHPMPPNLQLSEAQVYNIIRYIQNSWGNEMQAMSLAEVKAALRQCDPSAAK